MAEGEGGLAGLSSRAEGRVCRVFESERLLAPASNSIEPEAQRAEGEGVGKGSMGLALS